MAVTPAIVLLVVDLLGSQAIQRILATAPALRGARLKDAWDEVVELLNIAARQNAPHDLGFLIASIDDEVILGPDAPMGVVFTDQFYAPFQERGTGPYWPNIDNLEGWALRHGTTAFVVARAIARRGIIPLKYFEKTLIDNEDDIVELIGQAVGQVLEGSY